MTRVTQLIHDAGKYLLISVYPLPTHPTHNFTPQNGGNLETLPGWPKKLQHNRPARSAGQRHLAKLRDDLRHWPLTLSGLIQGLRPANERCGYKVTLSLIGWAQPYNQPCTMTPMCLAQRQSTILLTVPQGLWKMKWNLSLNVSPKQLTHCCIMIPYGDIYLGQHCLR